MLIGKIVAGIHNQKLLVWGWVGVLFALCWFCCSLLYVAAICGTTCSSVYLCTLYLFSVCRVRVVCLHRIRYGLPGLHVGVDGLHVAVYVTACRS